MARRRRRTPHPDPVVETLRVRQHLDALEYAEVAVIARAGDALGRRLAARRQRAAADRSALTRQLYRDRFLR